MKKCNNRTARVWLDARMCMLMKFQDVTYEKLNQRTIVRSSKRGDKLLIVSHILALTNSANLTGR